MPAWGKTRNYEHTRMVPIALRQIGNALLQWIAVSLGSLLRSAAGPRQQDLWLYPLPIGATTLSVICILFEEAITYLYAELTGEHVLYRNEASMAGGIG